MNVVWKILLIEVKMILLIWLFRQKKKTTLICLLLFQDMHVLMCKSNRYLLLICFLDINRIVIEMNMSKL